MSYIDVHPMEVRGTRYEIQVDEAGNWSTIVGSERISVASRDYLRDKLLELTAKASVVVAIPFVLLNGGAMSKETCRGVVTGIHAGNGNLLVQWTSGRQAGQKTQWTPSYQDVVMEGATSEGTVRAWHELLDAKHKAASNLTEFERLRKIDLRKLAVETVERAVASGAA